MTKYFANYIDKNNDLIILPAIGIDYKSTVDSCIKMAEYLGYTFAGLTIN